MTQKKRIVERLVVPLETLKELQTNFGMSEAGVYNALAYRSNSRKAQQIREYAINNGANVQRTTFNV